MLDRLRQRRSAIKKAWPLTDPGFWRGKELVDRQRALHSAVTCAWVTVIAAVPGASDWSAPNLRRRGWRRPARRRRS